MDLKLLLYFPLYLLAIFLAFYIPGSLFISKLSLTKLQKITLSFSWGIVLWGFQGFLFGYMHARWLTYFYLIGSILFWIKENRHHFRIPKISFSYPQKSTVLLGLLIAAALSIQLLASFATGIKTAKGVYFCCQLPDSLFHIALTNELVKDFPPYEPGVSNLFLKNYHFISNLTNADLIRIFHLPILYVQFPYTILFISLLFMLNVVTFAQLTLKKRAYTYWLLFFVFFSGDIMYLLTFITSHVFNFNSALLSDATTLWFSPPRVYGVMLLFTGISFLTLWIKEKKSFLLDILIIGTFGILIGMKVYFGIFGLAGLGMLSLIYLKEKNFRKIFVVILTFLVTLALYLPINSGAGGLVYSGFGFYDNFAAGDVAGLHNMELARYVYLAHHSWIRVLQYNLTYFILFFIFVFGTLNIAFIQTKKSLGMLGSKLNIFLFTGLGISLILGSFFVQQTGGTNSAQFLITNMIMISIYAALAATYWLSKIRKKAVTVIITLVIIGFTIPRVIYAASVTTLNTIHQKGFLVDNDQLQAMDYLRTHTPENAIILQSDIRYCLQMTFIAQRHLYICLDAGPADHGESLDNRIKLQNDVLQHPNLSAINSLRGMHVVQYLYMHTDTYLTNKALYDQAGYTVSYQNPEVTILRVP